MANPNILNATSIYGKTTAATLNTTFGTAYLTCATDKLLKVNTIMVGNISSGNVDVNVNYETSGGSSFAIARTIVVPEDSTIVLLGKDNPIFLEEGTKINAHASANSSLQIIISYEELDDA